MIFISVEKIEKLNAELECVKQKNRSLSDQVQFFQKFDFETQLNSLIELQRNLTTMKKPGNFWNIIFNCSTFLFNKIVVNFFDMNNFKYTVLQSFLCKMLKNTVEKQLKKVSYGNLFYPDQNVFVSTLKLNLNNIFFKQMPRSIPPFLKNIWPNLWNVLASSWCWTLTRWRQSWRSRSDFTKLATKCSKMPMSPCKMHSGKFHVLIRTSSITYFNHGG